MTSDDDNSEITSSFTHESVEIQSTKHTVDLEEGEIGDVSKSDDGDVWRQSIVGTKEINKSQGETSVENEADENEFENDLNQSMHSGDGTSRNGNENGDGNSVAEEFGSVNGENPDQKVDDDQQYEDSIDRNENESSKSVDGGIFVPIGLRDTSGPERSTSENEINVMKPLRMTVMLWENKLRRDELAGGCGPNVVNQSDTEVKSGLQIS
ncbi:hypothetical protein PsorP6_016881 [Peronosclerospora sorghi]|uniref:Uncharacterized protein n=1 Tax=Peronosclerospora sorghi TaxID=230839 RepID=A0ACC0WG06_9STRA|nr:hypothetical protein PsorP6_016881 [Peronosclerospora sorghi]